MNRFPFVIYCWNLIAVGRLNRLEWVVKNWQCRHPSDWKWSRKWSIFSIGYFYESKKTESIGPTVKMTFFPEIFQHFLSNFVKLVRTTSTLMLGYFFESRKTESIGHSVKMQNFLSIFTIYYRISSVRVVSSTPGCLHEAIQSSLVICNLVHLFENWIKAGKNE